LEAAYVRTGRETRYQDDREIPGVRAAAHGGEAAPGR
jgi:hypothetical protein